MNSLFGNSFESSAAFNHGAASESGAPVGASSVHGFQIGVGHLAGEHGDDLIGVREGDQGGSNLPLAYQGLGYRRFELLAECSLRQVPLHAGGFESHSPDLKNSVAIHFPMISTLGQTTTTALGSRKTARAPQSMPKKEVPPRSESRLTPEEREECARLKAAWVKFKDSNPHVNQRWLGEVTGLGTQGNITQYLNAHQPLNLTALVRICDAIGAIPGEISPRLAVDVDRSRGIVIGGMGLTGALDQLEGKAPATQAFTLPAAARITLLPPLIPAGDAQPYHVCLDDIGGGVAARYQSLAYWRMPEGDAAMVGTVNPGDVLLVDTADTAPAERGLFVVRLRGMAMVRSLVLLSGALRLMGSAPRSPVIDVIDPDVEGFEILGRVLVRIGRLESL